MKKKSIKQTSLISCERISPPSSARRYQRDLDQRSHGEGVSVDFSHVIAIVSKVVIRQFPLGLLNNHNQFLL